MIKKFNSLINMIEYRYLEIFSLILMILWTISPIIEYILKINNHTNDIYWVVMIYTIGMLGIFEYIIYFYKRNLDGLDKKNEFFVLKFMAIPFIVSIISSICCDYPDLAFLGDTHRKEGFIVYLMYVGFLFSASIIKEKKYIKMVATTIIISTLFITILPLFNSEFTYVDFYNIYYNTNHYAYFLMIAIMLAIFMFIDNVKYTRIFYGLVYIFLLFLLIRNDTFGCYLAILISLIALFIYVLVKKQKRILVSIILVLFVGVSLLVSLFDIKIGERVNFENNKGIVLRNFTSLFKDANNIVNNGINSDIINGVGTHRGILWKEAINYTIEHPIIGGGIENIKKYYISKDIVFNNRPHNIILQISSSIGIPCAIIYLAFILYLAFKGLKKIGNNTISMMVYFTAMCYFISSLFGNSMFYTSPYFLIILGFLISVNTYDSIKVHTKT